jgi:hypothetical protein
MLGAENAAAARAMATAAVIVRVLRFMVLSSDWRLQLATVNHRRVASECHGGAFL